MLPEWLALGLLIAGAASVVAAVLFVVGERLYPTEPVNPARERSGEWKRRREIREYLRAIDEPFAEEHVVAGTTVAFYLPRRNVAITFDAPDYFRLRNSGTYTVLAEHEMPGSHLGGRLPFETPDREELFGDPETEAADADSVRAAFATLGLSPSASEDEVKAAYRERIKEVHPDHGGDRETFEAVREAYAAARQATAR
ncbi:J domain-containing protein [Halobacterium wangiae]|uniref:J domain-containing protein n=1 Tax=Halobacterium wangiae TaxID=2902623 RepID=UPI001E2F3B3D|nr:J domain-containing protein [Halobacterium wangiae]